MFNMSGLASLPISFKQYLWTLSANDRGRTEFLSIGWLQSREWDKQLNNYKSVGYVLE